MFGIEFLTTVAPGLYSAMQANMPERLVEKVEPLQTKNGLPNLRIHTAAGSMTLHSTFDPVKEAGKLLDKMDIQPHKLAVIFGMGLGYHVDLFLEKYPHQDLVIVEPSYQILKQAMALKDFRPYFTNSRITFIITPIGEELGEFFCGVYQFNRYSGIQTLELPSYESHFRNEFNALKKRFVTSVGKYTANLATVMETGSSYSQNCMESVKHFHKFPWVAELFGLFKGMPAVLISAGPSLHLHLAALKNLENKAVLIAVDTAFPILQTHGINPHFVCTADPTEGNFIHLRKTNLDKTYLVIEPMTYSKIPELPGVRAFIANFEGYYSAYFAEYATKNDKLISWGSIASTCFDLARNLGCDPILFVGQDLAYSDFLTHCPGSSFDLRYFSDISGQPLRSLYSSYMGFHMQRVLDKPLLPAKDIFGKTVYTQQNLKLYAAWFSEQFAKSSQTIINTSERGILQENCHIMAFKKGVEQFCQKDYSIRQTLDQIYSRPVQYKIEELKQDLGHKISLLHKADSKIDELKEICRDLANLSKAENFEEAKNKIRTVLSSLVGGLDALIEDRKLRSWSEHENQKAETFFQRALAKRIGQTLEPPLVDEMANFYYNYLDSKQATFARLGRLLGLAHSGCS